MTQADLLKTEAPSAPVVLNTAHARQMLHKRYTAPEWALMEEVAPATGGGTRYADAVAINLWNSRGHAIHGFEIKVSRSDWLRELKQPEKAEDIYRFCDYWWILAPKGIVKDGELPPSWGLLELRDTGIVQVVKAPKLEPKQVTREFFASLIRRAHEQIDSIAEQKQRLAVDHARADIDKRVAREVESVTRRFHEREEQIKKFTQETGISFDRYSGPSLNMVKLAQRLESLTGWHGDGALVQLSQLAEQLERAAMTVRQAVDATGVKEGIDVIQN
ncbi:hypothetical protein [Undibacterium sp. TJN19]|uniref:hypothetical protein n=1 Tax=Undibacterium sp. TJN19 TaxID=3413055 RepID=UPI003BF3CE32